MKQRAVVTKHRKNMLSAPPDKPCVTCYQPMRIIDGWWTCPRHGPTTKAAK